ncbi:MAG: hypothetical protein JSU88_08765 [Nitrospinaceae bacterium]|jgi:hypothetical protein|nr:MAG: hypothetical protein JSU88_08765 [Nitrospinaceae bacterium]
MKKLLIPALAILGYAVVMIQMGWYHELSLESIAMTMVLTVILFGAERILFILGFGLLLFLVQFFIENMATH